MNTQQAVRILMLSPCYWLLDLRARRELVREFCNRYARIARRCPVRSGKPATSV